MARKRRRFAATPHFDHFAQDRQRDLRRRFRGDVETDRRVDSVDYFLGDFFLVTESLEASLDASAAAYHTNVFRLAVNDLAQARFVVGMTPGDQDDVTRRRDRHLF